MGKILIENCISTDNGEDGVRILGTPDLTIKTLHTSRNKGQGLNIIDPSSLKFQELPPFTLMQAYVEAVDKNKGESKLSALMTTKLYKWLNERASSIFNSLTEEKAEELLDYCITQITN